MQCWQCGKTVREGAKLCVYCGASLTDADDYERSHDEFERPPEEKPREPPRSRKTSGSGQRNRFPPQLPGQRPWPRDDGAGASRPAAGGAPSDSPKEPTHDRSSARSQDRADANDRGREARDVGLDGPSLPRIVYEPAVGSSRRSGNSPSRQSGDSASKWSGEGARLPDPLDDPRAPRILRSTPDDLPSRNEAGGGGRRSSRSANADAWAGAAGGGGYDPRQAPDRAAYPQGRGGASSGGRYQQSWDDEWRDRSPTGEYAAGYDMRTGGYDSESMEAWQGGAGDQGEHGLWPFYQGYADYPGGRGGEHDPRGAYRPAPPGYDPRRDGEWPESWQAPAVGGRGPGGPGRRPPQRKRRSPLFGVALGLVALVLVAAGVVERHALSQLAHRLTAGSPTPPPVFATYTPGPTPTVLPNYKQWANTSAGYVMNYPQQWTEKTDNSASGGQPDYTDTFQQASPFIEFAIEQAQVNGSQTDQAVIDAEVHAAEQKGATFTLTPGSTQTVAVGGEQWLREEFDGTVSGVQFHFALLSTHHHGRSYVIAMLAQSASFTNLDKTVFQPVLRSFRFLG